MKAIICDDEKSTCSDLEDLLLKYAKEKKVSLNTEVFYKKGKNGYSFSGYRITGNERGFCGEIYKGNYGR